VITVTWARSRKTHVVHNAENHYDAFNNPDARTYCGRRPLKNNNSASGYKIAPSCGICLRHLYPTN
jgi:hypothetical protein